MNIELILLSITTTGWLVTFIKYRAQISKTERLKGALKTAIKELKAEAYRLRLLEGQDRPEVAKIPDVKKHISTCIADCQAVAQISGGALQ